MLELQLQYMKMKVIQRLNLFIKKGNKIDITGYDKLI